MAGCKAFVVDYQEIRSTLKSTVVLFSGDKKMEVVALWDTGATNSHVSHDVVNQLQLITTGFIKTLTPTGEDNCKTYIVDSILLPNDVAIRDKSVSESEIGKQGIGLLIGMDIISLGDFAVSNYDGKTAFTFRIPSQKHADYVSPIRAQNVIGKKHGKGARKRKS